MDKIEKINHSVVQHGKESDRIYLMKYDERDLEFLPEKLEELANRYHYSKIFIKVPDNAGDTFQKNKYVVEAEVPFFFNGKDKGYFMAKYLNPARLKLEEDRREDIIKNIRIAKSQQIINNIELPKNFDFKLLDNRHCQELSEIYKTVFPTYPFPIHDPDYIAKTMAENIVYFGAYEGGKLVAASSSEIYTESENVEMTDFATRPEYRGHKLAFYLLDIMEKEMENRGLKTFYTIARAHSAGMNITFARKGYKFAGTLINNTNIFGAIESMNVWYK